MLNVSISFPVCLLLSSGGQWLVRVLSGAPYGVFPGSCMHSCCRSPSLVGGGHTAFPGAGRTVSGRLMHLRWCCYPRRRLRRGRWGPSRGHGDFVGCSPPDQLASGGGCLRRLSVGTLCRGIPLGFRAEPMGHPIRSTLRRQPRGCCGVELWYRWRWYLWVAARSYLQGQIIHRSGIDARHRYTTTLS